MAQDGGADGYELYYYSVSPRDNPLGPESAPYKVYRGGSWGDVDDRLLSVYYRNFTDPDTRTATIGFRCASSAADEPDPQKAALGDSTQWREGAARAE